jgi:hypothetical protein
LYNDSFTPCPKEDYIIGALNANLPGPGMYIVPGMDMTKKMTPDEEKASNEKHANSAHALIVLRGPTGDPPVSPKMLGCQLLACIVTSFFLALVIWKAAGATNLIGKMWMSALIGVIVAVGTDGSYHIWYGFTQSYLMVSIIDHAAGFFAAGTVAALVIRPRS